MRLRGTFTPLVTPFTGAGTVDWKALAGLIDHQLGAGVEGLVLAGTTGESPTIQLEEFRELLRFSIERAAGRTRIVAGLGTNDTQRTIEQVHTAEALGVDGLLVVCPYYSKPTQAGLEQHFTRVADATSIGVVLYNVGPRTGVNLETETLVRLAGHPQIVGVKEASGSIDQIMDVIDRTSGEFAVLSGCDELNYPLLALGGDGVISTLANLVPHEVKALVDAAQNGDWERARALHYRLLPLARGCFFESNPIPVKTALGLMGMLKPNFRLPMCPMEAANRGLLAAELKHLGLIS